MEEFDRSLTHASYQSNNCEQDTNFFIQDDICMENESDPVEKDAVRPDVDDYDEETHDSLIRIDLKLPKGDLSESARMICRKRDLEGNLIGKRSSNPNKDTSVYEVEFSDGSCQEYMANLIIENMTYNCDEKKEQIFLSILDHRKV